MARLGDEAGSVRLGLSLYELQPGQGMVFHHHLQREELLVVVRGALAFRTASGWRELPEGEVVSFPCGERGAQGSRIAATRSCAC
ncbi:MAG: cupin domain-containing protein [Gaiellaceae bacterium]